ncbi:MAG: M3 family oligoendopeptidase [Chloroherpetonaceae bacterium]|nr:M3 family oligoendopeptidase [Chloroherpetonaceae bacterium]
MGSQVADASLPRWDMTAIFPSLESAEFVQAFDGVVREIGALADLFDRHHVRRRDDGGVDASFVAAYEEVTCALNGLLERVDTLGAYIGCFTTTDAQNEEAQRRESLLNAHMVLLDRLHTRYVAWVGSTDVAALQAASEVARDHGYFLRRAQVQVRHQMSEAEEDLAAELRPCSIIGWSRLHGNLTALLSARIRVRGEEKVLPMSALRALSTDPDREVRRAAFETELQVWRAHEVPLAAALNGVKGFQSVVRRKRGWRDDVEPTLFSNSIDRATLEAMQGACVASFPDFRRYLRVKARALGLERLAWYDLSAPLGVAEQRRYTWGEAEAFILEHFGRYSSRLADFAARAFRERWIDAEPRIGKEGGAYCTGIRPGESRIMMNFDHAFLDVSTLAHELGHAYHNLNLKDRTPLQRMTPSTLAETASIFCETLIFDAAMQGASQAEQIALLDSALERDLMVVVDIHSRFLFEQAVFARRQERDLTPGEFCDLMTQAQRATYGTEVDPLHPYMWAVKGHYYGPTFYNYPYTFGLLFGLGIYALYRQDPQAFRDNYDAFLGSTGMADARELGARFGVDVTQEAFWQGSLDVIRAQIDALEQLIGAGAGA